MGLFATGLHAAEAGWVPDVLIRASIRRLLRDRLAASGRLSDHERRAREQQLAEECRRSPVAVAPQLANEQHYEVPAGFFRVVLGPRLKYSSGLWPRAETTLAESEEAALGETCEHARLADGQSILELGCGWGSLSLWMAEHYPGATITAVSNSHSQRAFIMQAAEARGFRNLSVITADMNGFATDARFDRVVSVEMFEHMRNHAELLRRISGWMQADGLLFVHHFCCQSDAYLFTDRGPQDWMSRRFFSGGMMPSERWLAQFDDDLLQIAGWRWSGLHYARTCHAWLAELDARRGEALRVFESCGDAREARRNIQRWRMFFMACAELFGYGGGEEWFVTHGLFAKRR